MEEEEEEQGSPSMHVPLRLLLPGHGGDTSDDYSHRRQLTVFNSSPPPPLSNTRFTLPQGWEVEEVPRSDASRVDKYYYERRTGNKFRSLREVERYINGEIYTPRRRRSRTLRLGYRGSHSKKARYRKMVVSGGKMLKLDEEEQDKYKKAIVPARKISLTAPHQLPDGWVVEEVPRPGGGYADKYYYEPGSGRKFRSLSSVGRYLAAQDEDTTLSETLAELREYNTPLSKAFKRGSHEKYYYEPGTGQKFRSLSSVDKNLVDVNEDATLSETLAELKEYNTPLSKAFKMGSQVKSSTPWKNNSPRDKVQSSTFNSPPMKINWVIASPGGDSWNPFISGSLIPESVQQQWSKRFMLSVNAGTYMAPNF